MERTATHPDFDLVNVLTGWYEDCRGKIVQVFCRDNHATAIDSAGNKRIVTNANSALPEDRVYVESLRLLNKDELNQRLQDAQRKYHFLLESIE